MTKRTAHLAYTLALLFAICLPCQHNYAGDKLILAVHPFLPHQVLEEKFGPLTKYLSKQIGKSIKLGIGANYLEHINRIGMNKVDIAYMGPASYVKVTNTYGSKPLLAKLEVNGRSFFQGNIIIRTDNRLRELSQLKGKQIAFGDPNSTMSFIAPYFTLAKAGVFTDSSTKYSFLHSHSNVALAVLAGDFEAGAVKPDIYKKYAPQGLKVIAQTEKISEHLFITRANLPKPQVKSLRRAMLEINQSPEGIQALHAIKTSITNLTEVKNDEYENLRIIMKEVANATSPSK